MEYNYVGSSTKHKEHPKFNQKHSWDNQLWGNNYRWEVHLSYHYQLQQESQEQHPQIRMNLEHHQVIQINTQPITNRSQPISHIE